MKKLTVKKPLHSFNSVYIYAFLIFNFFRLIVCSGGSPEIRRQLFEVEFERWLVANGATLDGLELYSFPEKQYRRGWRTLKDRERGSLGLLLPEQLVLSNEYFLSREYGQDLKNFVGLHEMKPEGLFVLGMLVEKIKGRESKWFSYFNLFLETDFQYNPSHPYASIDLDLLTLNDKRNIFEMRHLILRFFTALEDIEVNEKKFQKLQQNLKQYYAMNYHDRLHTFVETYLHWFSHGAYGPLSDGPHQDLMLVGIDLFNHETYARPQGPVQIISQEGSGESQRFYGVFGVRECKAGGEMFNSYDPIEVFEDNQANRKHCNIHLFTRFGFVLEDRDRDCFTFQISTDYVDRILYEYGKGNIGKQSIEDYYIPPGLSIVYFVQGIEAGCGSLEAELFSDEATNQPLVFRTGFDVISAFDLNSSSEQSEAVRCRAQVLYYMLQNELFEVRSSLRQHEEKIQSLVRQGEKEIHDHNTRIIHEGYNSVLKSFITILHVYLSQ